MEFTDSVTRAFSFVSELYDWRDSSRDGIVVSMVVSNQFILSVPCVFSFDIFFSMESVVGVKILISKCQHNL